MLCQGRCYCHNSFRELPSITHFYRVYAIFRGMWSLGLVEVVGTVGFLLVLDCVC